MSDKSQIFKVLDAERGKFVEQTTTPAPLAEAQIPYPRDHRGRMTVDHENVAALQETSAPLATANFPDLLRMGIQFDAWSSYNETPVTWPQFCRVVESRKQQEEYLFDSPVGLPPIVPEGAPYPEIATDLGSGLIIRNHKRGNIMSVTKEMQMFDQVGKVREISADLGRQMRLGEEYDVMNVLTTTTNYTLTNTAGDNDEAATGSGANTQALTFSATGLITAYNILRTMKDRKTGMYYNVMPDTLIVTPKLWWAAQKLIQSPDATRAHGATTAEVYGTGTQNTFFGVVSTIIVSPIFGNSYQWALLERNRALVFQRVEPFSIVQEAPNTGTYFERDVIRYRASNFYGVGMRDEHFAFFSSSTTAPTVS